MMTSIYPEVSPHGCRSVTAIFMGTFLAALDVYLIVASLYEGPYAASCDGTLDTGAITYLITTVNNPGFAWVWAAALLFGLAGAVAMLLHFSPLLIVAMMIDSTAFYLPVVMAIVCGWARYPLAGSTVMTQLLELCLAIIILQLCLCVSATRQAGSMSD